jgi:hypothetical protein
VGVLLIFIFRSRSRSYHSDLFSPLGFFVSMRAKIMSMLGIMYSRKVSRGVVAVVNLCVCSQIHSAFPVHKKVFIKHQIYSNSKKTTNSSARFLWWEIKFNVEHTKIFMSGEWEWMLFFFALRFVCGINLSHSTYRFFRRCCWCSFFSSFSAKMHAALAAVVGE